MTKSSCFDVLEEPYLPFQITLSPSLLDHHTFVFAGFYAGNWSGMVNAVISDSLRRH